jgi:hypothetical protein
VILRLHGPGGAFVLEHDFMLLLHLPGEKAHVVYFIASGGKMDGMVAIRALVV